MGFNIGGQVSELTGIGAGGGGGGGGFQIVTIIILILVFAVISAVATILIVLRLQFKYSIVVFERIDGRFRVSFKDRAKPMKLGKRGDRCFLLRKSKKIIPTPMIQTGKNIYWFFISDDGEWINFGPGDYDEDRREFGALMVDKEMRHTLTSLDHMFEERFNQPGFWEKYGGLVAYSVLILVTCIGLWLIVDKIVEAIQSLSGVTEGAKAVLEETRRLLSNLDTIKSGGSGYI